MSVDNNINKVGIVEIYAMVFTANEKESKQMVQF
jgi:hypothetical protein